jgi:hypothetical protein
MSFVFAAHRIWVLDKRIEGSERSYLGKFKHTILSPFTICPGDAGEHRILRCLYEPINGLSFDRFNQVSFPYCIRHDSGMLLRAHSRYKANRRLANLPQRCSERTGLTLGSSLAHRLPTIRRLPSRWYNPSEQAYASRGEKLAAL